MKRGVDPAPASTTESEVVARLDAAGIKLAALLGLGGVSAALSVVMIVMILKADEQFLESYLDVALGVTRLQLLTERESGRASV